MVKIETPEECNAILGTAHFIKTVEDLYECLVNSIPNIKFGIGFCESSGECLVMGHVGLVFQAAIGLAHRIGVSNNGCAEEVFRVCHRGVDKEQDYEKQNGLGTHPVKPL